VGGGLALLQTGDKVRIDLARRTADILIDPAEYERRRKAWQPPVLDHQTPWQELQRMTIGQLQTGACLDFAVKYQRLAETKGLPRDNH
jgi:dihydroxy-acid dehydratase